jgi:hypothetical protein
MRIPFVGSAVTSIKYGARIVSLLAASMALRIGTAIPSIACIRTVPSDIGDTANMSRALTYSTVIAPVVLLAATIFLATLAHAQSSGPGLGFWGSGGGSAQAQRMSQMRAGYARGILVPGDYQRMHGCGSSWQMCEARARAAKTRR